MNRHAVRFTRIAPALAAALVLAACSGGQPPGGGQHGFPPAEVGVFTVQPKSIPVTFEYVGQALGSKEVEVRARVGGILEKRLFAEGAPVKAGQTLFVLDPSPSKPRRPTPRPSSPARRRSSRRPARGRAPEAARREEGDRAEGITTTRSRPASSPPPR